MSLYNAGASINAPTLFNIYGKSFSGFFPNISIFPLFGFVRERIVFISVVFPEPFGPNNPITSPFSAFKVILLIPLLFLYKVVTLVSFSMAHIPFIFYSRKML